MSIGVALILVVSVCAHASGDVHDMVVMSDRWNAQRADIEWAEFNCTILDSLSGDTLAAQCWIMSAALGPAHDGFFFYTGGSFSFFLPESTTVIRIGHGPEYRAVSDTIEISQDTSVVYRLKREINMAELDWYSGDCHVHINHEGGEFEVFPEDAHLMGKAEGLNVVNCLDNEYYFAGEPDPSSTPDCIVYMSEENRSSSYGHLGLLGLTSPVLPYSSIWDPLTMDVADSTHAQPGALVVSAHPTSADYFWDVYEWRGSGFAGELPVVVVHDKIDAMEVLSFSNNSYNDAALDLWYRLLNCGFEIPACAGTDALMNRRERHRIPGAYRTYVYIPEDFAGGFTYYNWLSQLKAGRTFITNGPLIPYFRIEDAPPGDVVDLPTWRWNVRCAISIFSLYPFESVQIVRNGRVVKTYNFQPPAYSFNATFKVSVYESSWIAARVYGENNHWQIKGMEVFAHTGPVYVMFDNERIVKTPDVEYFIQWIRELMLLTKIRGEFPDPLVEARVNDELEQALQFYEDLIGANTHADQPGELFDITRALFQNAPNPFSAGTFIEFHLPHGTDGYWNGSGEDNRGSDAQLIVFDARGRVIRRLFDKFGAAGRHRLYWDGRDDHGNRVASGVYFYHLRVGDRSSSRKMLLIR